MILQRKQLQAVGDRLAKVCKAFGAKQILRLDNKNENILHQIYRCRGFFSFYFLLHSFVYCSYTYLQTVLRWLISYHWPVDLHISLRLTNRHGAKKETECPPKGSKQRKEQLLLHPQGCCIVREDILLTVWSPQSFSWFYYVRRKRSLLVAICGETFNSEYGGRRKNVSWPHKIQSRMLEYKWWPVHKVLGNVYVSSNMNDFIEGRENHITLDWIKTRPANLLTPWKRSLVKLVIAKLVKETPYILWNQLFTIIFKIVSHWILFWTTWINKLFLCDPF